MRFAGLGELRAVFVRRVVRLRLLALERRGVIDTRVTQRDIDHARELLRRGRLDGIPDKKK